MGSFAAFLLAVGLALCRPNLAQQDDKVNPVPNTVVKILSTPPKPEVQAAADAQNAHLAAESAKFASKLAKKVAHHSVDIVRNTQEALKLAHNALQKARADAHGLSVDQAESLSKAEAKLETGTAKDEHGELKNKLQSKLDKTNVSSESEFEQMRKELQQLRHKLELKGSVSNSDDSRIHAADETLKGLEDDLAELEEQERNGKAVDHDELRAEIEKLREIIDGLQAHGSLDYKIPRADLNAGKLSTEMAAKTGESDSGKLTYTIPRAGPKTEKKHHKVIAPIRTLEAFLSRPGTAAAAA